MPIEIKILGWTVCLGLLHIAIAATLITQHRGIKWNAGNREGEVKPLVGMAGRADRACRNFLETFPFFAVAVLVLSVQSSFSPRTALGAELYFLARLAYLPIYLIGIPYLRTAVWGASIWGLVMLLVAWLGR